MNIDSYQYINGPGNGAIGSLNTVRKNGINQSVTTQTTDPVVITTRPFCAPNQTSATTINQNYSLSMTANDVISGNSTSSLTITNSQVDSNSGCATSLEQNINVFVDQVTIQGCTCCTAIGDSQSIGGVNGHTLQATQPDQTQNYYTFVLGLGNSPSSACNDAQNGITRFCNCPIISSGCFVFTGSPINPQVVIGQSYMVNQTDLTIWELDSNSGQIIGQALDLAGVPLLC